MSIQSQNIINFVQDTSGNHLGAAERAPAELWKLASALSKVRQAWRSWNQVEVYSNPKNFWNLVGGHALDAVLDIKIIKTIGQVIIIAKSILICINEQKELRQSYSRFKKALSCAYPTSSVYAMKTKNFTASVSWTEDIKHRLVMRIRRIANAFFDLCKDVFKMSMRIMDVFDAFSWDPEKRNNDIKQIFVNYSQFYDELVVKKERWIEEINLNKEIINSICQRFQVGFDSDTMIKHVERLSKGMEYAQLVAEAGKNIVNNIGKGLGIWESRQNQNPLLSEEENFQNNVSKLFI